MKTYIFIILLIGVMVAAAHGRTRVLRQAPVNVADCILKCPTGTNEYNPVCGDNGVTYNNPSRLACAQNNCGVRVNMRRRGNCDNFN